MTVSRKRGYPLEHFYLTAQGTFLQEWLPMGDYRIPKDTRIIDKLRGSSGIVPILNAFQHWQQVDSFSEGQPTLFTPMLTFHEAA